MIYIGSFSKLLQPFVNNINLRHPAPEQEMRGLKVFAAGNMGRFGLFDNEITYGY